MITKYLQAVNVRMPAYGKAAKLSRVFLAQIPPRRRGEILLNLKVLQENDSAKPEISVKYKDGTQIEADTTAISMREMTELFDRYSRKLQINESLNE